MITSNYIHYLAVLYTKKVSTSDGFHTKGDIQCMMSLEFKQGGLALLFHSISYLYITVHDYTFILNNHALNWFTLL